ncbi:MAG: class I SAM-dependent methyltransferase [Candidatus Aminicenantia bacterium]
MKVADATDLPFSENSFDAVFAFGILHHIENWQKAISEIYRVLKPGGYFSFEEFFFKSRILKINLAIAKKFGTVPYVIIPEHEFKRKFKEIGFAFSSYKRWFGFQSGCFAIAYKK